MQNNLKNLAKIVSFFILIWVFVHFFAVFGLFVALLYPLWWIIFPKKTKCLICVTGSKGKPCSFCERPISKHKISPAHFKSSLKNGLLILLFSLVCLVLVILENRILNRFFLPLFQSKTAVLKVGYQDFDKHYYLGEIIQVPLVISDIAQAINAVQIDLKYDNSLLQAVDISTQNSFANIFLDKNINHDVGFVRVSGGLPNPGYQRKSGKFATVYFRTLKPGATKIDLLPSSMVLANNGYGSNVLSSIDYEADYYVLPEFKPKQGIERPINYQWQEEESVVILFDFTEARGAVLGEATSIEEQEPKFFQKAFSQLKEAKINLLIEKFTTSVISLDNLIIEFFFGMLKNLV